MGQEWKVAREDLAGGQELPGGSLGVNAIFLGKVRVGNDESFLLKPWMICIVLSTSAERVICDPLGPSLGREGMILHWRVNTYGSMIQSASLIYKLGGVLSDHHVQVRRISCATITDNMAPDVTRIRVV